MLYLKTESGRTEPDQEAPDRGPEIGAETNKVSPPQTETVLVNDRRTLLEMGEFFATSASKQVFLDTETTGLDPYTSQLVLIQIMAGQKVFLLEVDEIQASKDEELALPGCIQGILGDSDIVKVFHNAKFDLRFIKHHLFGRHPLKINNLFDTYIAENLLFDGLLPKPKKGEPGPCSLQKLTEKYLGLEMSKEEQCSFLPHEPLTTSQVEYAVKDVEVLERIFGEQVRLLRQKNLVQVALLEFSIIPAVADIELNGVVVDQSRMELMRKKCEERRDGLKTALVEQVQGIPLPTPKSKPKREGFNPNSPAQVKHVLAHLGIRVDSTSKKELEKINHPFARLMIEHRESAKLLSSFLEPLPTRIHSDGRIHPEFLQTGAKGGRFSCQKPNLQQIPKEQEWRDLFVAPPGYRIITADYSQIELRILAEYSQDPALIEVFRDGQDLHKRTISNMLKVPLDEVTPEQRGMAKTINFGICYGIGASELAGQLNLPVEEAEKFISSYHRAYPRANNTLQRLGMQAVNKGYSETLLGRKRHYEHTDSFAGQKSLERKGRNTPIQGTCADILKKAIQYLMDDLHPYNAKIIHLVHDEIVLEVEESQADEVKEVVRKAMVQAGTDLITSVPIVVEVVIDTVWRKQ